MQSPRRFSVGFLALGVAIRTSRKGELRQLTHDDLSPAFLRTATAYGS